MSKRITAEEANIAFYSAIRGELHPHDLWEILEPSARQVAFVIGRRSEFDSSELLSACYEAMLAVIDRFRDNAGASPLHYWRLKARGFCLDYVRQNSRIKRSSAAAIRQVRAAQKEGESFAAAAIRLGYGWEHARALISQIKGLSLEGWIRSRSGDVVRRIDSVQQTREPDPAKRAETMDSVADVYSRLSPRDCEVLRMYCVLEMSLWQVGKALGISEVRACQLKKLAFKKVAGEVENYRHRKRGLRVAE